MTKVVYNQCYGGFGISAAAVKLGRELSADPAWGGAVLDGERYGDGSIKDFCGYNSFDVSVSRHDKVLVQVVEQLHSAASGAGADLTIMEIQGTKYYIDEYDGVETVLEPEDIRWISV